MFRRESAVEYFKELVEGAIEHQGLSANELTSFYLVQLLASFVERPADSEHDSAPLAVRLARALEAGGTRQRASLKNIGDVSLFVSGFFPDSLARRFATTSCSARRCGRIGAKTCRATRWHGKISRPRMRSSESMGKPMPQQRVLSD